MYYYRARWYDSQLGRFISEDPIGFRGGDINLYGYVWNNPQNFVDPSGLNPIIKLARFLRGRGGDNLVDTGKQLTTKQAQNVRRNGGNVIIEGKGSQRVAEQIENGAFKRDTSAGDQLRHDPHGEGFLPHYQTNGKQGHSFYKGFTPFLAPNTVELSESYCTTNSQLGSAILWDSASLIDPVGLTDAIDAYTGLDNGRGGLTGLTDLVIDTSPTLSFFPSLKQWY